MFLGIDLGTSELKLLLLSPRHEIVATARAPLAVTRPRPLWSEQDPAAWWAALATAMDELAAAQPHAMRQVRGIGLSGQMHGAVLLDAAERVLRPAILWNDGRSGAQCAQLMREVPELTQIAGNLAMPGFTAPKLLWLREHEPEVFARTECVLLPKDHLRLQLTGARFTDCSDASGTLWLDVGQRAWSERLLRACGLSVAHMPALVEGSAPAGVLRGELARRWGLPEGVVVAGGGGDNAASAVGIGAVRPGEGFVSLGTSGVIFVVSDRFQPDPDAAAAAVHAFCHALPGRWHRMSVMLSAASCLDWAARMLHADSVAALIESAFTLGATQRERAPLFLPYLGGERTPHNNPEAQGVLFGLTHAHGAADVAWAVLEGIGFGLRDGLRSLSLAGARPAQTQVRTQTTTQVQTQTQTLALVGGGARSPRWAQLLASTLGVALEQRSGGEAGAALGAARLGWMASGAGIDEVCAAPPPQRRLEPTPVRRFDPDPSEQARLEGRYRRFGALYESVAGQFGGD